MTKNTRKKYIIKNKKTRKHKVKYDSIGNPCIPHKFRMTQDFLGNICIPKDKKWGSETERSLKYFSISNEKIPLEIIYSYAIIKKNAAKVNYKLGLLKDKHKMQLIIRACDMIINKKEDDQFVLSVWQTGSGSHSHMNVNEVISYICNSISKKPNYIDSHNDINISQSTNDTFGAAIQIAVAQGLNNKLIPNLIYMINVLKKKSHEFKDIIKIGKTHMEDAVPISFGQEFSGYQTLIEICLEQIKSSLKSIYILGLGGTAVGTGLNTVPQFGPLICKSISKELKMPFINGKNKFALMTAHNSILECSDALKLLATNIIKISNDIILMNSGPKIGFKQITIAPLAPGSSIMPGKVNPSECEAAIMASIQVIANNLAITIANGQGQLELNVRKPVIGYNIIQSVNILSDICKNLTEYCISTIKINKKQIESDINSSIIGATAVSKVIGYEKSGELYKYAVEHNVSLEDANKALKFINQNELKSITNPKKMI